MSTGFFVQVHWKEWNQKCRRIAELEAKVVTLSHKDVYERKKDKTIERLREVATHAQALLDGGGDEALHHLRKALAALEGG